MWTICFTLHRIRKPVRGYSSFSMNFLRPWTHCRNLLLFWSSKWTLTESMTRSYVCLKWWHSSIMDNSVNSLEVDLSTKAWMEISFSLCCQILPEWHPAIHSSMEECSISIDLACALLTQAGTRQTILAFGTVTSTAGWSCIGQLQVHCRQVELEVSYRGHDVRQ